MNYEPTASEHDAALVSVVIPTLNGEKRIRLCIESILVQNYPRECLELIVVDDDSSDQTVAVCRDLGVDSVIVSGARDIEVSKALGITTARGKYLLLIDDDNRLVNRNWLKESIDLLNQRSDVGAVQSVRFEYRSEDPPANRYCSLMGINDPLVYYLKRSDRLTYFEAKWTRPCSSFEQVADVALVKFDSSALPTLGSQGFLTRTNQVRSFLATGPSNHRHRFYHLDYCRFLTSSDTPVFGLRLDSVAHDHCTTVSGFVAKCSRNAILYLDSTGEREFDYRLGPQSLIRLALISLGVVVPLRDSIRGYMRIKDPAWFLHIYLTPRVFLLYTWLTVKHRARRARAAVQRRIA